MPASILDRITPLILTLDEEPNIERVLSRLAWAREIVVVDSGSTDGTRALLARYANVRCVERRFDSHAAQWNYGLSEAGIVADWVLALDADYVLTDELVDELKTLSPAPETVGYRATFRYCVFGRQLRGTLYPPVTVLYRRAVGRYVQDGHTQRWEGSGRIEELRGSILHDDRKPVARWLASQVRYARLEADLLHSRPWRDLGWPDRLRTLHVVMPPAAFAYCLIVAGGLLDGWPGLYYAIQRGVAEAILSLALIESRIAAVTKLDNGR
jgi:glycosyltransferase involved in cell wall biosynthesis